LQTFVSRAANGSNDEGFSMRAIARVFCEGLTLPRVDKPSSEPPRGEAATDGDLPF
tara:strand:- start:6647 stop:6814 length:168 start_codon:yes stop_codon:yes gene_type:complete